MTYDFSPEVLALNPQLRGVGGPPGAPVAAQEGKRGPVKGIPKGRQRPERDFQQQILDLARLFGWRVHHTRPAWTSKGWRTPIQGDAGFVDLVLVRNRVIFAELKAGSALTPDQYEWLSDLQHAGAEAYLWTPEDFVEIESILGGENE